MQPTSSIGEHDPVYFDTRPLLNVIVAGIVRKSAAHLEEKLVVAGRVKEEFDAFSDRFWRKKVDGVPESRRDQDEVRLAFQLREAEPYFAGDPFRVVALEGEDAVRVVQLSREHRRLHAGERELVALCERYGGSVLLDDRAGHEVTLSLGLQAMGTLDLLVQMVQAGHLALSDGEGALMVMRQAEWERAPSGRLADYVNGQKPIW